MSLDRVDGTWRVRAEPATSLRKRHDLQGPIDDAFMDSFVMVKPTQKSGKAAKLQQWVDAELPRAIEHWRRHFRGEARVKDDTAIGDDDIRDANLILWGDPESNAVLKRIAAKLPIGWDASAIKAGDKSYDSENHALIAIYPNPLNPNGRRAQQRIHVPRLRLSEQRPASRQAAGLGRDRPPNASELTVSRQGRRRQLLRGIVGIAALERFERLSCSHEFSGGALEGFFRPKPPSLARLLMFTLAKRAEAKISGKTRYRAPYERLSRALLSLRFAKPLVFKALSRSKIASNIKT